MSILFSVLQGVLLVSLAFFSVGAWLSAGLQVIGAFSNTYTQLYNGKRGLLISGSLGSGSAVGSALSGSVSWTTFLLVIAVLCIAFLLLPAIGAALRAAETVRRVRARAPLGQGLALAVASVFIPTVVRADWWAEGASYLHEAEPNRRWAWCWDYVRMAPLTGMQLAHPVAAARVSSVVAWLAECCRNPAALWSSTLGAVEAVVLSRTGTVVLSVIPVLGVGVTVWLHSGWFAVIENADNLSVVAIAVQGGLLMLRRWARRRRRPGPASSP